MPTPSSAYLVCATPRSGSTLLCETLRATGVAGNPLEHFEVLRHSSRPRQPREYFEGVAEEALPRGLAALDSPRPDPEPAPDWWARIVREGTTDNGVWGGKLMWGHVDDLVARARKLPAVPFDAGLRTTLRALLGRGLRFVYVTRADKVAQAVSLWRAVQTQTWRAEGGAPVVEARYDFAAIDHLVRQLDGHDARWRGWLIEHAIPAHEVSYDALVADPRSTIAATLRVLGLPDDDVPAPATRRQGDDRSQQWVERYWAEREAA